MTSTRVPGDLLPTPKTRAGFDLLVEAIVARIPPGRVMTYGQIAALIPTPRAIDPVAYKRVRARWVGYALGKCSDDLPWHRVVNAAGKPSKRASGSHLPQPALLEQEGLTLSEQGGVELAQCRWQPPTGSLEAIGESAVGRRPQRFVS